MSNLFETYLQKVAADLNSGVATEHTYRPALATLLEAFVDDAVASNDPKHIACGAPDFIITRRKVPLGYIETKEPGVDLDKAEKSEQLQRYREALHNFILTDYLEFRWYVNGEHKRTARLATIGDDKKLLLHTEGFAATENLLQAFYQNEAPIVATPRELAERMAQLTRLLSEVIDNTLREEDPHPRPLSQGEREVLPPLPLGEGRGEGALHRQFKTFQDYLLPNLKPSEFADIYAQTMAYGLFAARVNAPLEAQFNRSSAYEHLSANRFLRKLFLDVGEELESTPIAPFLDDLAALLARADLAAILKDFGKRTRTEDPVVHFYETFLAAYDPSLRESRGVYYTPEPAVQFIVNSIDWLLRHRFDRGLGLADKDVCLLDPATGTSTFLYFVVRAIHETLMSKKQSGAWQEYVHTQLLPRLFGFELLVAPYVIAHLKLGLLLRELGYQWSKDDRLRIYLTNALDEGVTAAETLGNLGWYISQEANEAAQVKKSASIMVVTGNPPYSNFGMLNKNKWINGLIETYKHGLHEKKLNLDDDYIKFIRFGQWRIEKTGQGILALITNNSFIDGLTHRRMREALMETFTDIYILDLHGSSKKQESAPDGSKDENIFDIQQGVSISLFIKEPNKRGPARVHHAELWGRRKQKLSHLVENDVNSAKWKILKPQAPHFFFVPKKKAPFAYQKYWPLNKIFVVSGGGFNTDRDELCIDFERKALEKRMRLLFSGQYDSVFKAKYRIIASSSYDIEARARQNDFKGVNIRTCIYRPFDHRHVYYQVGFTSRPVFEVQGQMLHPNLALLSARQTKEDPAVLATTHLATHKIVTVYDRTYIFPLYLYPNGAFPLDLFEHENGRRPNLSDAFVKECAARLGLTFTPDGKGDLKKTFGPEDVFNYAYAIFHSPTYRERYAEFLKIDFPRLPLTSDKKLFAKLAAKGAELVSLHLLKTSVLDDFISTYPVAGDNVVERVQYDKKKVWINEAQHFGNVPESVWEFQIGGYQVCDKWLKDRKGRALSSEELLHYQRVLVALKETMHLMAEIDKTIPSFPLP